MAIYKIFRPAEWQAFFAARETAGAPVDLADGFIHFSSAGQLAATAARHFAAAGDLVLAAVDDAALGADLRWQPSRGGARFAHLYRPLTLAEVLWARPLPPGEAGHVFPPGLA